MGKQYIPSKAYRASGKLRLVVFLFLFFFFWFSFSRCWVLDLKRNTLGGRKLLMEFSWDSCFVAVASVWDVRDVYDR